MKKNILPIAVGIAALACLTSSTITQLQQQLPPAPTIKLPQGFQANIVADSLGPVRHLVVTANGNLYVKMNNVRNRKGLYYLTDNNKDGIFETKTGFGDYPGTGIKIKNGYLYSSSNSGVYRYKLNDKNEVIDTEKPELLVSGLVDKRADNAKSFVIDDSNNMYVAIGSYSDACRAPGSIVGIPGCPLRDSVGGIWKFKADKPNQTFGDGMRFATGVKNSVGIDINPVTKTVFVTQHGRSLDNKYPQYYTSQQVAQLPAEALYELKQGVDAGWPFAYYDNFQNKYVQSPEYGGDGKKSPDVKYLEPQVIIPAHFAPNDLLFYTGKMFPAKYRNGAFMAFHAQSPEMKKGYLVAFVPFKNGKPSGNWEIFADNFSGTETGSVSIQYRPTGLAQGPDGALYVADDIKGTIFKISYSAR
ncbi:PQQ-dependent sugar dehydrogenase [Mucilaginibacter auburnensis]|uniref:Glucose/arabinose dehydrogenase n=1 Tax=Mucilaginibacter auburnensis TaxID=1457233 RepID=A0A2H9VP06_9SPHI|nr:PQQ-dependent sugar dehydrogenase [Mucilaginibacter auburnensis]PJJ80056.1 glucose/arabinose dehydrogenase [Mucilaginibacter auburnensis]